jgi:hypothetical protein
MIAIQVKSVDYAPDDLYGQTPFDVDLLRLIPGSDASDYWLGQLRKPLQWQRGGTLHHITHVVVAARHVGRPISPGMRSTGVNISYVTDPSILQDAKLEFSKCSYVAIGVADAA